MRTRSLWLSSAAVAFFLAGPFAVPAIRAAGETQVLPDTDAIVSVTDVHAGEHDVSGVVVNRSNQRLVDVVLAVSDSFRWKNEFHPGEDDPGGASDVVVHGPIEPGGSMPFRIERELPVRHDGWFETRVQVSGLTMFDPTPARATAQSRL